MNDSAALHWPPKIYWWFPEWYHSDQSTDDRRSDQKRASVVFGKYDPYGHIFIMSLQHPCGQRVVACRKKFLKNRGKLCTQLAKSWTTPNRVWSRAACVLTYYCNIKNNRKIFEQKLSSFAENTKMF